MERTGGGRCVPDIVSEFRPARTEPPITRIAASFCVAFLLVITVGLVILMNPRLVVPDRDSTVSSVFDSRFVPPHSDFATDTSGNGLYDVLVIRARVNIASAGGYDFGIMLFTGTNTSGDYVGGANATFELSPGLQLVDLPFDGGLIRASRYDGNFTARLYMLNQSVEIDQDIYVTSYYAAGDFDSGAARFEGGHDEFLVDTNNDTRYEYLVVNVTVNVTRTGDYQISSWLTNASSYYIGGFDCVVPSTVGLHLIQLNFSGVGIYESRSDGPYMVHVELYDWSSFGRIDWVSFWTDAYQYLQFEPDLGIAEPISDYGLDTDGDGLFNYLVVEVTVNLADSGICDLYGTLRPYPPYEIIDSVENYTDMNAGLGMMVLFFSGKLISGYGSDGPFLVQLILWTNTSYYTADYTTNTYLASQFEAEAKLVPPLASWPEDSDSDGLYDSLIIEAMVLVEDEDDYILFGKLYSDSLMVAEVDVAGNFSHLTTGNHMVEVSFSGWMISSFGADGIYYFLVDLCLVSGVAIDFLTGNTTPLLADEFEHPPEPVSAPWLETFENGPFGSGSTTGWYVMLPQSVSITSQTSEAGEMSLAICGTEPYVKVLSPMINVSGLSSVEVRYWIRIGSSEFSDSPDWEDELHVYLWNSTDWQLLEYYAFSPAPGSEHVFMLGNLSEYKNLTFVQLLFVAVHGSGPGTDYWHMDDIYIGPPHEPFASVKANLTLGDLSTIFEFNASSSWDIETPFSQLQFRWDWDGDGTWDTGWSSDPCTQHKFASVGTFQVKLEVMDAQGNTNITSVEVLVLTAIPEFPNLLVPLMSFVLLFVMMAQAGQRRHRR